MYKQIMFAIAAAVLLTAVVTVASFEFNIAKAQTPPPGGAPAGGAGGNASAGGAGGNATGGNATGGNATAGGAAGANMTKK